MKNLVRVLLCLLMLQMAACTAVPAVAPVTGRPLATRTSVAVASNLAASTAVPAAQPTALMPAAAESPVETAVPAAAAAPTSAAVVAAASTLPETVQGSSATPAPAVPAPAVPAPAAESLRGRWEFFSGTFLSQAPIVYRLRYPAGWFVQQGEDGMVILQNFPLADGDDISYGRIRVQMSAAFSSTRGGFPAPNQKILAAGRPGTRQVLVDSTRAVTVWNVRLYGLSDSSAVFQLTGFLSNSPDPSESVRLLDAMLNTLELYAWPEPTPTPAAPSYAPADTWQPFTGRLEAGPDTFELRFRIPQGWWVYPGGAQWLDVTNWMVSDAYAGAQPSIPGSIKLTINAEPCEQIGGCPAKPGWLNNDMPGTREISHSSNGETLWLVQVYHGQARFTLSAILSGSEEQVQGGILMLNMLLRTLEIRP